MSTKIITSVYNDRIIENTPKRIQQAVLYSLLENKSITNNIVASNINSFYFKSKKYYKYGESGGYLYGLPEGQVLNNGLNLPYIKILLGGDTITLDYVGKTPTNRIFPTYQHLQNTYGWNVKDKILNTITLPAEDAILNPVQYIGNVANFTYNKGGTGSGGTVQILPSYNIPLTDNGLHVMYHLNNNPSVKLFWFYDINSSTYPNVELNTSYSHPSEFYPVVPVRMNKNNSNADTNTTLYKDTRKALKYLSLNVDDVISSIEENPDKDQIDDAFVLLGTNIYTDNKAEIKYLYLMFEYYKTIATITETYYNFLKNDSFTLQEPFNIMVIKEQELVMKLLFSYISKTTVSKVIGDIGSYSKEVIIQSPFTKGIAIENDRGSEFVNSQWTRDRVEIYKQTTPTQCIKITVSGLRQEHEVRISGTYGQSNYNYHSHTHHLTNDTVDLSQNGLIVPVNKVFLDSPSFKIKEREEILYRSLTIIIYGLNKIHLKWYQTGIFKALLIVVAIVLTVYTAGTTLLGAFATSATAGYLAVIKIIAITILVDYSVEWVLKNVDGVLGDILAILILVVASAYGSKKGISQIPWSDKLLKLVDIFSNYKSISNKLEMENLVYEVDKFTEEYELRQEELKDIKDLLSSSNILTNPLYMLSSRDQIQTANDTPDSFYNRHIHNMNPAVKSLDYTSKYVASKLLLPEVEQIQIQG